MHRRLLNLAAGLSLLLCITTTALWIRSAGTHDVLQIDNLRSGAARAQWRLSCASGSIELTRVHGPIAFARPSDRLWWSEPIVPRGYWWPAGDRVWGVLGASVHIGDFASGPNFIAATSIRYWTLILPLWMLTLFAAAVPIIRWHPWRRRPVDLLRCHACGYDLRATPHRCPECGTPSPGAEDANTTVIAD